MKILISNPILYTSETPKVNRANSIKDTMIYDLCLAFTKAKHDVTLVAAEDFKPQNEEHYPFEVIFFQTRLKKVFRPNCLPWLKGLHNFLRKNGNQYDFIISSEVFSVSSLLYALTAKNKLIVWHELAKHNNILKKLPSYFWYNIVARLFFKNVLIVGRSHQAQEFISQYCNRIYEEPIEHGVNLDVFTPNLQKSNSFFVCSQLIPRKQVDGIVRKFSEYIEKTNADMVLNIAGSGECESELKDLVKTLGISDKVCFLGKLSHADMMPYMSKAKALLVNTRKDNSILTIVEALSVCTPIVTNRVPYNATYVDKEGLGIVNDDWNWTDLEKIYEYNDIYVDRCEKYRNNLSTENRVEQFTNIYLTRLKGKSK